MTDRTDQLSRRRYILAALIAVTYLVGELASLTFVEAVTGLDETVFAWIENISLVLLLLLVGIGGWSYLKAERRDAETFKALNDELSVHHGRMAAVFAFKFVFALSLILLIMTKKMTINAEDVARIIFASCLVILYLRFAYLELKHG